MRTNGYIYLLQVSGGGVDLNGEPILTDEEWSDAIPCNIATNSDTRKGVHEANNADVRNGGSDATRYRQASFTILLDSHIYGGEVKRVKLERFDEDLGEYDVLSIVSVPGMGRIQIIV